MPNELQVSPEQVRESCLASYATFCQIMQEDGWFDPVHQKLCDFVQYHVETAIQNREDAKILLVMPRGTLKSTIVTKYLPIWLTLKDSNFRSLVATNTHPNAQKKLENIRGVFDKEPTFRALWPDKLPTTNCRWTDSAAEIPHTRATPEATFEACGMNTKKEGTHYNLIIEDDTTAPGVSNTDIDNTLPTQDEVDRSIGWHRKAVLLLVPKITGDFSKNPRITVVVSTRWAEEDLIWYIKAKETGWKVFDVPAIREDGTPTFKIFYSVADLEAIKERVGPYLFSSMFLNQPLDASQRKFKNEWITHVGVSEIPQGWNSIAIDPAISEKDDSCETAITRVVHYVEGTRPFMVWRNAIHGHFDPFEAAVHLLDLVEDDYENTKYIIIEENAYQAAFKFVLRDEMIKRKINVDIIHVQTRSQKMARIEGLVPYFANGRIKLARDLDPQAESQLKQFPHGRLVDVLDSFCMHLRVAKGEKFDVVPRRDTGPKPGTMGYVLDQNRKHYAAMNTAASHMDEVHFYAMETGLGSDVDSKLVFSR